MTVCIGAIAENDDKEPWVIGITDSMMTFGEPGRGLAVEVETTLPKGQSLASNVAVLMDGDLQLQLPIIQAVKARPEVIGTSNFANVGKLADIYTEEFIKYRTLSAENKILGPIGLTLSKLWERGSELPPEITSSLLTQLGRYPDYEFDTSALILGVDETGAHIFTVPDEGLPRCHDNTGFASIGIGQELADFHFITNGHSPCDIFPKVLITAYGAKRRAQLSPGVGERTVIFHIHHGTTRLLRFEAEQELDKLYKTMMDRERDASDEALVKLNEVLESLKMTNGTR